MRLNSIPYLLPLCRIQQLSHILRKDFGLACAHLEMIDWYLGKGRSPPQHGDMWPNCVQWYTCHRVYHSHPRPVKAVPPEFHPSANAELIDFPQFLPWFPISRTQDPQPKHPIVQESVRDFTQHPPLLPCVKPILPLRSPLPSTEQVHSRKLGRFNPEEL